MFTDKTLQRNLYLRSASLICILALSAATALGSVPAEATLLKKNFYLFYLFQQERTAFGDPAFAKYKSRHTQQLNKAITDCKDAACYAEALAFSDQEIKEVGDALVSSYLVRTDMKAFANKLRKSGFYAMLNAEADTALLRKAWQQASAGVNHVLSIYIGGKTPRYPKVDAISFAPGDKAFSDNLNIAAKALSRTPEATLEFYTLPLGLAIKALMLNGRDETARYEPLTAGMNKKPYARVSKVNWSKYPYSLILVPGLGPEQEGVRLDPGAIVRCDSAAARYKSGRAPFIVVSGGHVHPNKTPFCEAVEMKKYMVQKLGIPDNAIFIEPHARHTTTNLRNVNRMIYLFKIPDSKPVLTVTDASQSKYILGMAKRCVAEMGYVPYRDIRKLSDIENEYYPLPVSLQSNPIDPLDP